MTNNDIFSRNEMFWGNVVQEKITKKNIFVFGLGGVGGFALEALARCGIENFTIIDFDTVSKSNINRQIIAFNSTVGIKKTELFKNRLSDINPDIKLRIFDTFYKKELNEIIFDKKPDFVIDAIDFVKSKIDLIKYCKDNNINIVTSLGAGNRINPTKLKIVDISEIISTKCNFLRNILKKLEFEGITKNLTAVISDEKPHSNQKIMTEEKIDNEVITKITPSSTPIVPAVCGYLMAWHVIEKLIN